MNDFHVVIDPLASPPLAGWSWQPQVLGIDLVQVERIQRSLEDFGERFERRLFTEGERAEAGRDPLVRLERLAARFAAKEAAIKAFGLSNVGVNWKELEVCRLTSGAPCLVLHGRAALHVRERGITHWALSLSHDGGHAVAVVAGLQVTPSIGSVSP